MVLGCEYGIKKVIKHTMNVVCSVHALQCSLHYERVFGKGTVSTLFVLTYFVAEF